MQQNDMQQNGSKKERLVTVGYIILCFAYFAAQFGYSMSSSNISKYARSIGVGDYIMGILPGLMSFAALFSRPLAGWISDHFDRKKMMLVSLLSLAAIFVAYRFSTNTPVLLTVRILHGVIFAIFSTVNMAFVADAVPRSLLLKGMGYYAMIGNLAQAFAPAAGVWIINHFSYAALFLSAAVMYFISFLLLNLVKKNEEVEAERANEQKEKASGVVTVAWWQKLISVAAIPAAFVGMCNALLSGGINGFLLLYSENRGVANASLFFTLYAIVNLIARPFILKIAEKVKEKYIFLICDTALLLVILCLFNLQATWQAVLAGIFFGIGYGGLQPIIQTMAVRSVPISERGNASSTYYIGLDLGQSFGPMIVSFIATTFFAENYGMGYAFLAIPVIIGCVVMFWLAGKESSKENQEKA